MTIGRSFLLFKIFLLLSNGDVRRSITPCLIADLYTIETSNSFSYVLPFFSNTITSSHIQVILKGAVDMFRLIPIIFVLGTILNIPNDKSEQPIQNEEQAIIIETNGEPSEHKEYIETYYPAIEVVHVYEQIFNGLALKGRPDKLQAIGELDFVHSIHPVKTYQLSPDVKENPVFTNEDNMKNHTSYTGKGIKVAVIDTGVDYEHPDLQTNYKGGYDLVDLDSDPMETKVSEGMPTSHGTHVAGIIGANGYIKGVAPEVELYAYRALGPGGVGTSIQVIAAIEHAVKDDVDIINLSLGNTVNGPDYPTSQAVNKAVELGKLVVIANGNSGPQQWTVGAPATASKAIAVGAYQPATQISYLYHWKEETTIPLHLLLSSVPWDLTKAYPVVYTTLQEKTSLHGKIALIPRGERPFYELAREAEQNGAVAVLFYNNESGQFRGSLQGEKRINIPVAALSQQMGHWLKENIATEYTWLETKYQSYAEQMTSFSSRGPVTVSWGIKPNIVAPGKDIISTVPGGYAAFDGTSMAAPYIAGLLALMKQAHPNWTNEQIQHALLSNARPLTSHHKQFLKPSLQGTGLAQIEQAINAKTIIHNPYLTFGKTDSPTFRKQQTITIENMTNQPQTYSFNIPEKERGIRWQLPRTFTLQGREKKHVTLELDIQSMLAAEGIHEGFLQLHEGEEIYHLPYTFIHKTADYPKTSGFEFTLKPFDPETFVYRLYVTAEEIEQIDITLYEADSLLYKQHLLTINPVKQGIHEGQINRRQIQEPGLYRALITLRLADGTYENSETEVYITP